MLKRAHWLLLALLLFVAPVKAEHRFIVRTTLGPSGLQQTCLLQTCTVVRNLDGTVNRLFLVTIPDLVDPNLFLGILRALPGIVDTEVDQLLTIGSGLATLTTSPPELSENSPLSYYGAQVWYGYANQPAAQIVRVSDAHNLFGVSGSGIVADIDTGVDPTHPALAGVLLAGYDFTRNQPGASELLDWPYSPPSPCPNCQPAIVNQSTAAVLDQSTAAVLEWPSIEADC